MKVTRDSHALLNLLSTDTRGIQLIKLLGYALLS